MSVVGATRDWDMISSVRFRCGSFAMGAGSVRGAAGFHPDSVLRNIRCTLLRRGGVKCGSRAVARSTPLPLLQMQCVGAFIYEAALRQTAEHAGRRPTVIHGRASSTGRLHGGGHMDSTAQALVVGGVEVLNRLGAGGMGEVYLGRHLATGMQVAVKLLKDGATAKERFLNEARLGLGLADPHLV